MIGSETEDNNETGAFSDADALHYFHSQSFDHQPRHCGEHVYDYLPSASSLAYCSSEMKGCKGEDFSFPVRLHYLLDVLLQDNLAHLACWQPHGRCFVVHNPDEFSQKVLPLWFRQSRFGSFQRQLNLYGFRRMKTGRDKGGYYHPSFIRGQAHLAQNIKRIKAKKSKLSDDEEEEPNFYSIPFVPLTYPAPVVAVQRYGGQNSRYAPHPHQPYISLPPHPGPVPAPPPAQMIQPTSTPVYETSIPTLSVPHFDVDDVQAIHNENTPVPNGAATEINVPLLQSKLLASPSRQALTYSLSYAYTHKEEPSPATATNM